MQSGSGLQERAAGVVFNFLARQRGSYVTLSACGNTIRYEHQQQMSISLDAAAAKTAE